MHLRDGVIATACKLHGISLVFPGPYVVMYGNKANMAKANHFTIYSTVVISLL